MTSAEKILSHLSDSPLHIIDPNYAMNRFMPLDLSVHNNELSAYDITNPRQCQAYIDTQLTKNKAHIAYGGYLEERNLYKNKPGFGSKGQEKRNIHLGIDIWAPPGTAVVAPFEGVIHSFKDNSGTGNYGPTLILEHQTPELSFYTLYGHLSHQRLDGLKLDRIVQQGEKLATLGNPTENGNYAPHLHFQIILKLDDYLGDYPGVCAKSTIDYYMRNCPDPNILLKIQA